MKPEIIFVSDKKSEDDYQERAEQAETLHAMRTRGRARNSADVVETLRDIKENGAKRFRGTYVDSFSASAFIAVYDNLKEANQVKLKAMAEKNLPHAISICFQLCK